MNPTPFDRSKYLMEEPVEEPQPIVEGGFDRNKYAMQDDGGIFKEGFDDALRQITRTGSRVGETILGLPGDFANLVKTVGSKLPGGKGGASLPELISGKDQGPNFVQQAGKKLVESLPTQQDLQRGSQNITKGYTAPRSEAEQLSDEIFSLGASLAIPARNPLAFGNLFRSLGLATGAKGAKQIAKEFGASEKGQVVAELGTLLIGSMVNPQGTRNFINNAYQQARNAIPQGTMVNTSGLARDLNQLENTLRRGTTTPSKNMVIDQLEQVQDLASRGHVELTDLVDTFHSINENMTSKKLWEDLGPSLARLTRQRFDDLRNTVREEINRNPVPGFTDLWNEANRGYAVMQDSRRISNWVEKNVSKMPNHLTGTIALELILGHPQVAAGTAAGASAAFGAVKTAEALEQIARSPLLRQHYVNAVTEASRENLPAMISELERLNKGLNQK